MYSYTWDEETGGLLLNSSQLQFSKEPRPVFSKELDILGFRKFWNYDDDDSTPIMWAEANNYIYRGRTVAMTKGGAPFIAPKLIILDDPEPNGSPLRHVDIEGMIRKNEMLLEQITQDTIKKIYNVYSEYKSKVDVFYVAFSGGKDSLLALDLVQRALPHNEFKVLFGDTMMEFSDTYRTIELVKQYCKDEGIEFLTAKSHLSPEYTWHQFGPPAQKMRWCCSVHKTTPQIILLRRILNNPHFRGMAFTGIRAEESVNRSNYEEISMGEKIRGQYSCHPVLEWNSAELYLYTFANHLIFNDSYKKGNSRAGCIVCPLAGYKNMWFKEQCYSEDSDGYPTTTMFNNIILETTSKDFSSKSAKDEFMNIAGWKARRSGRELSISRELITEVLEDSYLKIILYQQNTDWREWLKTIGKYTFVDNQTIELIWDNSVYRISIDEGTKQTSLTLHVGNSKSEILLKKHFKIIARKCVYCIGCQVCQANCPSGFITMENGNVVIDDRCIKCRKCHDIDHGCLLANSVRLPIKSNKMGSVNRYGNMGIEFDWIKQYLKSKDEFWGSEHSLGSKMVKNLEYFLNDSEITVKKKFSKFGEVILNMDIESARTWGLILCNLAYTAEFNWWIKNIKFNNIYSVDAIKDLLENETDTSKTHIVSAFKNILISNPTLANEVGLGVCDYSIKGNKRYLNTVYRSEWNEPSPEVVLYSLYKFAEACGDYKQFTLARLIDNDIDSDGVSPVEIFGIEKEKMTSLLKGLSVNYPDFINVSFTLDLDNITLKEDKSSNDVLSLF